MKLKKVTKDKITIGALNHEVLWLGSVGILISQSHTNIVNKIKTIKTSKEINNEAIALIETWKIILLLNFFVLFARIVNHRFIAKSSNSNDRKIFNMR